VQLLEIKNTSSWILNFPQYLDLFCLSCHHCVGEIDMLRALFFVADTCFYFVWRTTCCDGPLHVVNHVDKCCSNIRILRFWGTQYTRKSALQILFLMQISLETKRIDHIPSLVFLGNLYIRLIYGTTFWFPKERIVRDSGIDVVDFRL
jgi:hypothetical protein